MIGRTLFYGLVFTVAVGLPYLTSGWSKKDAKGTSPAASAMDQHAAASGHASEHPSLALGSKGTPAATESHPPLVDMADAFRFDITPNYLMQRWPRVTAGLPVSNLQGYRVPLVTGAGETDLAGSLTYYFNPQQQCERIEFRGANGNPNRLVQMVTSRFGLTRQSTEDAGLHLYQTRWNGEAVSEMKIRPVRLIRAATPNARYEIELTLVNWKS
ncbi:MAG: DUF6690 family protein [Planctomycetota bacterium]|nr:DUF6690 family protein [Planctomycetota bacterium]